MGGEQIGYRDAIKARPRSVVSKFSQSRTSVLPYSVVAISAICHSGDASIQTWPDTDGGGDEQGQATSD